MVQQVETAPAEASEPVTSAMPANAGPARAAEIDTDVPASPAALWASESRGNYSITHTEHATSAWVDCDCVIHSE